MTAVKICGITRVEDALLAADLGAAFLGLVFHSKSPRAIDPEAARTIGREVRARRPDVRLVGVVVDESAETVRRIVSDAAVDYVQLHGAESPAFARDLGVPAIKALRVNGTLPRYEEYECAWVLFDAYSTRAAGGTGESFAWNLLDPRPQRRFFLAGGLTAENVAAAIRQVRPDAVDVSSGVEEAPGVKSAALMRRFFEAVRSVQC